RQISFGLAKLVESRNLGRDLIQTILLDMLLQLRFQVVQQIDPLSIFVFLKLFNNNAFDADYWFERNSQINHIIVDLAQLLNRHHSTVGLATIITIEFAA